jgi:hypothetical protein
MLTSRDQLRAAVPILAAGLTGLVCLVLSLLMTAADCP